MIRIPKTGLSLAGLAVLAAACGSPAVPRELADARVTYSKVSKSPNAQLVPADMLNARDALARAERQYGEEGDDQSTRDLAYVAQRRAVSAAAKGGTVRASLDKQLALADLENARRMQSARMATELESSKQKLSQAQQQMESERQARIAADQRAQDALSKIQDLKIGSFPRGLILTISGGVLFATGKSVLLPSAQNRLKAVADALKEDPRQILIVGHTDNTGKEDMNQQLSEDRAEAVKKYLVQQGIPDSKLRTQGMGETQPIASNKTPEGRANNRRVEIIMENEGGGRSAPLGEGPGVQGGTTPSGVQAPQEPSMGPNMPRTPTAPQTPTTPTSPHRLPPSTTPPPATPTTPTPR